MMLKRESLEVRRQHRYGYHHPGPLPGPHRPEALGQHCMEPLAPDFAAKGAEGGHHRGRHQLRLRLLEGARPVRYRGPWHIRGHREELRPDILPERIQQRPCPSRSRRVRPGPGRRDRGDRSLIGPHQGRGREVKAKPIPPFMLELISEGGLINHLRKELEERT